MLPLFVLMCFGKAEAQSPSRTNDLSTLDLGGYDQASDVFSGNKPEESIGVNVDVKFGKSQEIIKADELAKVLGKELTRLDLKLHNESNFESVSFIAKISIYITKIDGDHFVPGEKNKYYFLPIDKSHDCVLKDFNVNIDKMTLDSEDTDPYIFQFQFDKPYLYSGGNLLLTIETQASSIFGESSRSFCACLSYPKNVKGLPVMSLCDGSDKKDVTNQTEYKSAVGAYKDRTVKLFYYRNSTTEPEKPLEEVMSIANETAGKLQEKISDKQIQFVKDLTITGILNREDMDYVYSSKSIEKLHLGQAVLKQDTLWSPSKQNSDIPLPNLKEIDLPQTLKAIGASALSQKSQLIRISGTDSLEYIGVSALANDSLLRAFSFGNRLQKIDSLAFMGCKSLVDISLPDSLSWLGAKAFKGCSSITHLTIPEKISQIDSLTFNGCSSLDSVSLLSPRLSFSFGVFSNCNSLVALKLLTLVPPVINEDAFNMETPKKLKVYVPYQAEEAFLKDAVWNKFTIIPVGKPTPSPDPVPQPKEDILELGNFSGTNNCFDASVFQIPPVNVDYNYSKSQDLMLASELSNIEGKTIYQINYRLKLPEDVVTETIFDGDVDMYISSSPAQSFVKDPDSEQYQWIPVNVMTDKVIDAQKVRIDAFDLVSNQSANDYILSLKLDKPFVYKGGDLVVSIVTRATQNMANGTARSFADFYCYPENAKGMPFMTACAADDKTPFDFNVKTIKGNYGLLRHRAVKQLLLKKPDTTDALLPTSSVKVLASNHQIIIDGIAKSESVCIYDMSGRLLYQAKATGQTIVDVDSNYDVVIVKVGSYTKKVAL